MNGLRLTDRGYAVACALKACAAILAVKLFCTVMWLIFPGCAA